VSHADTPNFFGRCNTFRIRGSEQRGEGHRQPQADVPGGSGAATTETGPRDRIPRVKGGISAMAKKTGGKKKGGKKR